ncbi:fructose-specific PTS transporter subunit EIIC [Fusobacterium sp.]|uniref:PTS fructose transporter subunit IIABC n=1 Tax=Fusobacterium sp. TaxID=68766 RepID=UPI0025BF71BF|nr:fructose-specific PTS transporter subunit EIIC [Fusobacterium sp.]
MLSKEFIKMNLTGKNKNEILEEMVDILDKGGVLNDKEEYLRVVKEREATSSTGLEEGIAIPHGKTKAVKKATIAFGKSETGVDFNSLDGEKARLFFMIAAPEGTTDEHIEMLSKITNKLLNDEFREKLDNAKTEDEIIKLFNSVEKKENEATIKRDGYVVAVTACPVGIAHTYMAADSLINKALELGVDIKVETNGSVGVKNELTTEDIKRATGVIIAADKSIDMDRFEGKKLIQVPVKEAIRIPEELINKTLNGEGTIFHSSSKKESKTTAKNEKTGAYKHLMNGVSNMLPLVVCGGVLIALSIALSGIKAGAGADVTNPFLKSMLDLGVTAFGLMIPVLSGYIAMSIADRPGLAPGLVGGALANTAGAGFLGGMVAGFAAGYIAKWVKNWNVPAGLRPIMPIFVIPLVSTGLVGILMYFISSPISGFMNALTNVLKGMQAGSIFLALILGLMISFDMGGPINKVAFLFGSAMITQGVPEVMGPIAVAICIPPIGMGLATMIGGKNFEISEREAGKAAFAMGLIGITEGAIPFAAADPLRVIPSIMTGSAIGAVIAAIGKVTDHAPHGGPIVLPVVDNKLMFIIAIVVGSLITAIMVNILKKIKK